MSSPLPFFPVRMRGVAFCLLPVTLLLLPAAAWAQPPGAEAPLPASRDSSGQKLRGNRGTSPDESLAEAEALRQRIGELEQEKRMLEEKYERFQKEYRALTQSYEVLREGAGDWEKLKKQRDALIRQLEQTGSRSKENALKRQLAEQLRENNRLRKSLRRTEEELRQARARLARAQQQIVQGVSENERIKVGAHPSPHRLVQLAQQHERLLRENAALHYNLGVIFSQRKEYDKAAAEFQRVVELRPDDADAHYNLGVIFAEHLPNQGRAMAYFRRYLELDPLASDADWVKQYLATGQAQAAAE